MQKTKLINPQVLATLSGTILVFAIGFHVGWSSPALPKLLEDASVPVNSNEASLIVSIMPLAGALGAPCSFLLVDRWGRKTTILLVSIPFVASGILLAFAQNFWWYFVARFAIGISGAICLVTSPMYTGEIADDKIRGGLGVLIVVMHNLGNVLAYSVGPWISLFSLAMIGTVIPIVAFATFVWMPETPYFYMMKNKPELARKSLQWLKGKTHVDEEIEIVKKNVEFDLQNEGTFKELFVDKGNRKGLLILLCIFSAQQFSGIFAVLSYSTTILNDAGLSGISSISVVITGLLQLVVSFATFFITDRAGRRPLLLLSMFFSTIFLISMATYFQLKTDGADVSEISWLPVVSMFGYIFSYSFGLGPLPGAVVSEVFSCSVKSHGTTITITYFTIAGALVTQFYPSIASAYGIHIAYYIFAVCVVIFMVFTFFYLPETKGKSFNEIQQMLHTRSESKQTLRAFFTPEGSQI